MSLVATNIGVRVGDAQLLNDVDLVIAPGELVAVVGPNGAGKSTLLAAIAGDRPVDTGTIYFGKTRLSDIPLPRLAALRAVVASPPQLAFDYTVADIVSMGWIHGVRFGPAVHDDALLRVLDACELLELADRVFMTLSQGERQRVQFARGLLQLWRPPGDRTPRWLLLDEPTANLDLGYAIDLLGALKREAARGTGVMAIVHDLDLGVRFADRVVLLEKGCVVATGKPEAVMTSEILTRVYKTPVHVEYNLTLGRMAVLT